MWLTEHEQDLRLGFFVLVFVCVAVAEYGFPRKFFTAGKWRRWMINGLLVVLGTVLIRFLMPVMAIDAALLVESKNWGLLHQGALPAAVQVVLGFLLLDVLIYFQHRVFHLVPVLWRLHRVHHSDVAFDVSTGIRFHPVELLLSMVIKIAAVCLFGVPVVSVIVFEIVLNATSLFNHGNFKLPLAVDRVVRWLLVTPDMHRVHHSLYRDETDSNFGFNLSWWDRLFGSYHAQPREGHEQMRIGLQRFRDPEDQTLSRLLSQPFVSGLSDNETAPDRAFK